MTEDTGEEECSRCRFFTEGNYLDQSRPLRANVCRRFPPKNEKHDIVMHHMWCGCFKRIPGEMQ